MHDSTFIGIVGKDNYYELINVRYITHVFIRSDRINIFHKHGEEVILRTDTLNFNSIVEALLKLRFNQVQLPAYEKKTSE